MNRKFRLKDNEMLFVAGLKGITIDEMSHRPRLTPEQAKSLERFRSGVKGDIINEVLDIDIAEFKRLKEKAREADEILTNLKLDGHIEVRNIEVNKKKENRTTVPIIQYSDWHVDEVVDFKSVLGLNEYNPKIAQERADTLFYSTCKIVEHHQENYNITDVVLALQGDFIGGWIHDELMQTNAESPLAAIRRVRGMLLTGLKYIHENMDVDKIHVVCVSGNHSRTSRKIQFANFSDVSLEYGMYKDLEELSRQLGLTKLEFTIPKAEMVVVEMLGKRMLFAHGHEFKYAGGIGGIYPSMLRWFNKISHVFKLDVAFIGHWHQSISTPQCVVNSSLKGYDAYAMGKGLDFQPPSQNMTLLDSKYGFCLHQEIFPF